MSKEAIATIIEEHRSLKAIVHGLKHLLNEARTDGGQHNFKRFRAMLHYIDAYPERRHHPKEETFIFAKLRLRTDAADQVLDELEQQHQRTEDQVSRLHERFDAFEAGETGGLAGFANAVDQYAEAMWQHMAMEEKVLLPLARSHLTDQDWAEIGDAFRENADPAYVVASRDDLETFLNEIMRNTEFEAGDRSA